MCRASEIRNSQPCYFGASSPGIRRSCQLWLIVVEKLLRNLLRRAEEIAIAMDIRGFISASEHKVQWHQLKLRWRDWVALCVLIPFWFARFAIGGMF